MKLTAKQERFCIEYVIDCNATQAAIRAGYSKRTAHEQAAQLLAKLSIKQRVAELMAELESAKIATAEEVLQTLTRVLRREEPEHMVVTLKKHKSWYDDNGKKMIEDSEEAQVIEVPASVANVNKAADLLGKRYGIYTDKVDVTGTVNIDDARTRLAEKLAQRCKP